METLIYFLIFGALFFFMMRFGCGAHVMGHGHGHGNSHASSKGDLGGVAPEKDIDPVCGMTVETAEAKSAVHDGRVYYFCSPDCRQKFEANPASYIRPATGASHAMEHHHES